MRDIRERMRGFTLIELIIVIAVIALLSTLVVVALNRNIISTRDSQRATSAQIIADALEKYYAENGEYPGCEALTSAAGIVRANTLKGIDESVLLTPNAPSSTTNSIQCTSIEGSNADFFAYEGDTSTACKLGPACATFSLSYRQDATGNIATIQGRHTSEVLETRPALNVEAVGMNGAKASWTEIYNATSYQLQRSPTAGFASVTTTTHTGKTATISGLTADTDYYFRIRALTPIGDGPWSEVTDITTSGVNAPTGTVTIAGTISGTTITATTGGGTCPAGTTIQRQIRYNQNNAGWQAWTTIAATTRAITGQQGSTYTLQAQARCMNGTIGGSWLASATKAVTIPVTAPSGLTITAAISGVNAVGTAGGGSCAAGTTLERQMRYNSSPTATAGTWSGWTAGTSRSVAALRGHKYIFMQQARCVGPGASSTWTASAQTSTVYALLAPAVPTVNSATQSTRTWAWTAVACPTGTTRQFRYQFTSNVGAAGAWITTTATSVSSAAATSQGVTYGINVQAQCYTVHTTGPWSGSSSKTFVVPIVHSPINRLAIRLNKHASYPGDGQARMKIKDYVGSCASGTIRESVIQAQYDTHIGGWYSGNFFTATATNLERNVDDAEWGGWVVPGEKLEARMRTRCRNTTTNYATNSAGETVVKSSYDIGNIYETQNETAYKISCAPVSEVNSFCAGGYNSVGTLTASSLTACAVRYQGIANADQRFTALIPLGTNGPSNSCWNI